MGGGRVAPRRARTAWAALVLAAATVAGTAGAGTAAAAAAAPETHRCSEQESWPREPGQTYVIEGDLVGDVSCHVTRVQVLGDVHVDAGAHLGLYTSVVEGDVVSVGAVYLDGTIVLRDVHLTGGAGLATYAAHVHGSVQAAGSIILDDSTIDGDLLAAASATQPWLRVVGTTVRGDVVGHGGDMTFAWSHVGEDLSLARWTNLRICEGTVGGDVLLTSAAGTGALGASSCGGRGPTIWGSLTAVDVQPSVSVLRTSVGRDLRCVASPGLVQLFSVTVGGFRDPGCRSR